MRVAVISTSRYSTYLQARWGGEAEQALPSQPGGPGMQALRQAALLAACSRSAALQGPLHCRAQASVCLQGPPPLSQQRQALPNQRVWEAGQCQGDCNWGAGREHTWEHAVPPRSRQLAYHTNRCLVRPTWQAAREPQLQQVEQVQAGGQPAADGF